MVYATHGLTFKVGQAGSVSATMIVKDINSLEPKLKGEVKTWSPLDQKGWQRALMTGKALTISHKGERNEGDPGNDLIADLIMATGSDCTIPYEIDFPSGAVLSGNVVVDISTPFGGASTDISGLEWDAVFDGKPNFSPASAQAPIALSASNPLNNVTEVSVSAKPTLTFNNAISDFSGIALLDVTTGSIVPASVSIDSTRKIVTLTPTANFTAAHEYVIAIAGVTDIYNQVLATTSVKFTC